MRCMQYVYEFSQMPFVHWDWWRVDLNFATQRWEHDEVANAGWAGMRTPRREIHERAYACAAIANMKFLNNTHCFNHTTPANSNMISSLPSYHRRCKCSDNLRWRSGRACLINQRRIMTMNLEASREATVNFRAISLWGDLFRSATPLTAQRSRKHTPPASLTKIIL